MLSGNRRKFIPRLLSISLSTLLVVLFLSLFFFSTTYAADLDSIQSVKHGGVVVAEGDTVERNDLLNTSTFWQFYFDWPHGVSNTKALFFVFKGEFGDIEGGIPVDGVNYSATNQSWSIGQNNIGKFIGLPALGDINTASSTYTVLIAESLNDYDFQVIVDWFASGGVSGSEPVNYSTLTFTYDSTPNPINLNSIEEAWHGGRYITEGETVLKKEITTDSSFWQWKFTWPNAVPNLNALFIVFRGEFGAVEGGVPIKNVNYSSTVQAFGPGMKTIIKSMGIPTLANESTQDGTYTMVIIERDPKYMTSDPESLEQIEWFASGGTSGILPLKYSFFTFEFREFAECCSNVVFLPGIKGSILKEGNDTLWPPTIFSNDIPQLALTEEGESVNPVVVDGILESFFSTSIYDGFVSFMDGLVADGDINEWKPFPYDWRYSPEKIILDGVSTPTGVVDVIDEIETLAGDSETGKVTIVAHSMGGLLGKAIIKELEDQGKVGLIDSFVMIGTPQLGTPQAVGGLLHGDGEGILGGLIVDQSDIREIAQNMPSAYNLLPSSLYFDRVPDPVILFNEDASFTEDWRDFWGPSINSYLDFFSFITGGGVVRTDPSPEKLQTPEILRPELVTDANDFHSEFDEYIFPDSIRVVQVAGWGLNTVKAIEYRNEHFLPSYRVRTTVEGDNTVVYPSAISSVDDETYFFDLDDFNDLENIPNFRHRDLLNSTPIQDLIELLINNSDINNVDFITNTKPQISNVEGKLIVSTHSPVILGAYDDLGNFTGIDPNQDLSSEILFIIEEIPGSSFLSLGGSHYLFLPKNRNYNFIFQGIGEGPTTVVIQDFSNDIATDLSQYSNIPVSPNTKGGFNINSGITENVLISLDTDGDGEVDEEIPSDSEDLTLEELFIVLKEKINGLNVKKSLKKNLLKKIDKLEKKINKNKKNKEKVLSKLKKKINKKNFKGKIGDSNTEEIINLLDIIEGLL